MKLMVLEFIGSWVGGALIVIAESEDQVLELFAQHIKDDYPDARPNQIVHSYDEYVEDYRHNYSMLLIEKFDVPEQTPRIVSESYHSG